MGDRFRYLEINHRTNWQAERVQLEGRINGICDRMDGLQSHHVPQQSHRPDQALRNRLQDGEIAHQRLMVTLDSTDRGLSEFTEEFTGVAVGMVMAMHDKSFCQGMGDCERWRYCARV